jgi:hypothetical protein
VVSLVSVKGAFASLGVLASLCKREVTLVSDNFAECKEVEFEQHVADRPIQVLLK